MPISSPNSPLRRAKDAVVQRWAIDLAQIEVQRRSTAATLEKIEALRRRMVHNASDAGMSRSQIAAALGVTPARAHQLATQDLPGMISWIPFSAFVRQAEVSALEAAELLRDATVIALPDSHPPMFRRHELGAALERIRGGLHSGMTVTVANGIRSQRDDRLLEGKSGRFVRVIAVGERPVVEIDIAEEGPTFLFLDQVIPASALSDG